MNEQIKIMIRAITSEAEKNLAAVRKELDGISKSAAESSKTVDKALVAVGKGAVIAVGAITALTTAMVALGKSSVEFQKTQARLVAGFQSMGLTAGQASEVYGNLFAFLGEADTAVEAANLLAQLTQEEAELTEWTQILQGVYAKFPDSLPVESLAEAVNHTAQLGEVQGTLADALEWSGVSVEGFNAALANTNSVAEREALIRSTLNGLYMDASKIYKENNRALIDYNKSQVAVDMALADATRYVIPLMTALNNLTATLLTAFAPALEAVSAYLTAFIQLIVEAIQWVGSFFGLFSSGAEKSTADVEGYRNAMNAYLASLRSGFDSTNAGANETMENIEKLKRQAMGFDELNVVQSPTSTSAPGGSSGGAAGGGLSGLTPPNPADYGLGTGGVMDGFIEEVQEAREMIKSIMPLVAAVAGGLLLWKLADFLTELAAAKTLVKNMGDGKHFYQQAFGEKAQAYLDDVVAKFKLMGGMLLIVAGALLLVKGYSDAWINGLDWENFALILSGIAAIVGGIALAFGPMAAAIALVVGGIVALVIGIKDLISNGYSMEAVIMVAVGAIAILIGVIWALNAALLANPITWIVVAVMALVAVFVILWNECEGFRNFWIGIWEVIKAAFAAFIETCQPLFEAIKNAFNELWLLIQVIWGMVVERFNSAWVDIMAIWDMVKPYFEMVWNNIKIIFSVVVEVLGSYFRMAWEVIKVVWSVVVSYFRAIWDSIAGIFSVVRNVLQGNWQGAWDAIKGIVGSWGKYFQDVWAAIKKIFGAVGTYFSEVFRSAWNGIKKIFDNVGTYFTGVWNKIKDVFSKAGASIASAVSTAFSSAINWVLEKAIGIVNGFIDAINLAISVLNAIPGVSISKLSRLNVPKLATGGITSGATLAMIGERGKEAVLPLENNTGWMDMLADRIAARNSAPSKIVLNVDGRELGWASINNINDITKQTGGLQLHIV